MSGIDLGDTEFQRFNGVLTKISFRYARLTGAYLDQSYLGLRSNFEFCLGDGLRCNLVAGRELSFRNSSLRAAVFRNALLWDADFDGADVAGADFSGASLEGVDRTQLSDSKTTNARFSGKDSKSIRKRGMSARK
jgi:uncharacterized protein YjbI with pentapeptide repeats